MAEDFSDNHPELRDGEMFLQNVIVSHIPVLHEVVESFPNLNFKSICFTGKRLGNVAYDKKGKILPLARPVFVNRKEFESSELAGWSSGD